MMMKHKEKKKVALQQVFPNWAESGGIFKQMESQGLELPWQDFLPNLNETLDLNYFGNKSGLKNVSPLVYKMLTNEGLSEKAKQNLASTVYNNNILKWKGKWDTYFYEYNPIENYNREEIIEEETNGTHALNTETIKKGTSTTTDKGTVGTEGNSKLTHGGTDTLSRNGTSTSTDKGTVGNEGTNTLTNSGTDSYSKTGTEQDNGTSSTSSGKSSTTTNNSTNKLDKSAFNLPTGEYSPLERTTVESTEKDTQTGNDDTNNSNTHTYNTTDTTTYGKVETTEASNTETRNLSKETTDNGTDTTTYGKTETDENTNTETRDLTKETTDNGTDTGTETGSENTTHRYKNKTTGNIGVMSTQQMIEMERRLYDDGYWEMVYDDVDKILTDGTYCDEDINGLECIETKLPIASKTKLGAIKVGDGLEITDDGTLSSTGGDGKVKSVNGKDGVVVLNAQDVGALPSSTEYVSSVNDKTGNVSITPENIGAAKEADLNKTNETVSSQGQTITAQGQLITSQGQLITSQGQTITEQGQTISQHSQSLFKQQTRISNIEMSYVKSVNTMTGDITLNYDSVGAPSLEEFQQIEDDVEINTQDITALKSTVGTNSQNIATLTGTVETQGQSIQTAQTDINTIKNKYVSSINGQTGDVEIKAGDEWITIYDNHTLTPDEIFQEDTVPSNYAHVIFGQTEKPIKEWSICFNVTDKNDNVMDVGNTWSIDSIFLTTRYLTEYSNLGNDFIVIMDKTATVRDGSYGIRVALCGKIDGTRTLESKRKDGVVSSNLLLAGSLGSTGGSSSSGNLYHYTTHSNIPLTGGFHGLKVRFNRAAFYEKIKSGDWVIKIEYYKVKYEE